MQKNNYASVHHVSKSPIHFPQLLALASLIALIAMIAMSLAPSAVHACACGCGVFEVGTDSMFPRQAGGMFSLEYDYQNQDQNWNGNSRSAAANNPDKDIRTSWVTAGVQYMFNRSWGVQVEVPYEDRAFTTTGGATGSEIASAHFSDLGDMRVQGIYTGFSPDMSAGVTFGFKLPTGNYSFNDRYGDVDRDSEIGTGTTDLLLGGFYRHEFSNDLGAFLEFQADLPLNSRSGYRPGLEVDEAVGVYYNHFSFHGVRISPVAEIICSERTSDGGPQAAFPRASGYNRVLVAPGIEFDFHPVTVFADVEIPVYIHTTGDQLIAPVLVKVVASYNF